MAAINRFQFLKQELLGARREISFERAVYYTESWKESEGQPNILRRARALRHVLAHMNISIREGEILAGNRTMKPRSGIASPEMSPYWIRDEIDSLYCRPHRTVLMSSRKIRNFFSKSSTHIGPVKA